MLKIGVEVGGRGVDHFEQELCNFLDFCSKSIIPGITAATSKRGGATAQTNVGRSFDKERSHISNLNPLILFDM